VTRKSASPDPPVNEVAVIPSPIRRPPTLMPAADSLPGDWPSNLDLSTPQGKAALINAGNPPVWSPVDGGVYRILATHWIVYPDERVDEETGAVSVFARTCFIDATGQCVKLSNDWAPRRLHAMLALYSPEEWAAGIEIECYTAASRRKGQTYGSFRIVCKDDPAA
jgi:hypothetical protein